ncbi:hypothetical protein N7452_008257 [Penicillium brevicompactum]|uniref:Apple domain-containing protein n=1 Tax=Penicillium brevicompactum TaxID=5074 RepID=A0A9W9Q651_PENBR|nr:hypothetical protein N7452_008257 [Penicillium brevicompactum]
MHETKHEIQPEQWVLVKCGWVGSHDGRKSRVGDIRTPTACVQLCSDDPACTHSSWGLGEKCLLSGSKFTEREVKNSVLLIMTTPDDLQDECPEDNPYCDDEEEEEEELCEEQLEESETQLENCEEEKNIYQEQLAECLIEQETLAQQVFDFQSAELSPKIDVPECDMSHGTIFTARNNKRFRIDCRKGMIPLINMRSGFS